MAETYQQDYSVPINWTDLTTVYSSLVNVPSWVQNKSNRNIVVSYTSSSTAPVGGGRLLKPGETIKGTASNIWAKAIGVASSLAFGVDDVKVWEVWTSPSTAKDLRIYGDVEIQVIGTPSAPYIPSRSGNNSNFVPSIAYDGDTGNPLTSITAAGFYRLIGTGYMKFTAGAGSTILLRSGN